MRRAVHGLSCPIAKKVVLPMIVLALLTPALAPVGRATTVETRELDRA